MSNFDNINPEILKRGRAIATMCARAVGDQKRIAEECEITFAAKTYVAPADSPIGVAVLIMAEKAKQFAADKKAGKHDKKARFQDANMLATMVGRWVKTQERFKGRRVSVRTTGESPSLALVVRTESGKGKPKASKGSKAPGIKSVKDLASLVDYAVDHYGLEALVAEVAKRADAATKKAA